MNMKIAIVGNRKTCSLTRKFNTLKPVEALVKAFPGAEVIEADPSIAPTTYTRYRNKAGMKWPYINVLVDGKSVGFFVARNMTMAEVIAEIKELCPACCDGGCGDGESEFVECPTCNGTGKVLK